MSGRAAIQPLRFALFSTWRSVTISLCNVLRAGRRYGLAAGAWAVVGLSGGGWRGQSLQPIRLNRSGRDVRQRHVAEEGQKVEPQMALFLRHVAGVAFSQSEHLVLGDATDLRLRERLALTVSSPSDCRAGKSATARRRPAHSPQLKVQSRRGGAGAHRQGAPAPTPLRTPEPATSCPDPWTRGGYGRRDTPSTASTGCSRAGRCGPCHPEWSGFPSASSNSRPEVICKSAVNGPQ